MFSSSTMHCVSSRQLKLLATDWVIDLHMEGDYSELVYLLVFLSIYLISRVFEQFIMKEPTFPQEASCFHGTQNSRAHFTPLTQSRWTAQFWYYITILPQPTFTFLHALQHEFSYWFKNWMLFGFHCAQLDVNWSIGACTYDVHTEVERVEKLSNFAKEQYW